MPNFNPRAPYGARPVFRDIALQRVRISIHAPHTGRDDTLGTYDDAGSDFNPRAPYGARLSRRNKQRISSRFQSTRPIRGATHAASYLCQRTGNFNPRAPYGARPNTCCHQTREIIFQSTRPIRGATYSRRRRFTKTGFQSTRPIRGATRPKMPIAPPISNFNPRAPYGARQKLDQTGDKIFDISIHAPHTGRDDDACGHRDTRQYFNPRAPYGARQQKCIIYVLHFCNNRQLKHKNQQETSSVRTFF